MTQDHLTNSSQSHRAGTRITWIGLKRTYTLHKTSRLEILTHLADIGYDVYLFGIRSSNSVKVDNPRVHLILIPWRYSPIVTAPMFAILMLIYLPLHVLTKKPNIIIAETGLSILAILLWAPLLRWVECNLILDIRTPPVEIRTLTRYVDQVVFFNVAIRLAERIFDGITTLTELMKGDICRQFAIDSKIVGVWGGGVSTRIFDPEKYDGADMRKRFGITNKFVVFFHGYAYGFLSYVVDSMRLLKDRRDVVLFVLGSGASLSTLKRQIQDDGIENKVIIHDPVDYEHVPEFIAMCDVGIVPLPDLPEWRHQRPFKLLEYLAMNKAVIVTDVPANRDVIGESKCGIYIPSVDPSVISGAIMFAYDNNRKLKEWGAAGRRIVEDRYSWERVARDLGDYLSRRIEEVRQS